MDFKTLQKNTKELLIIDKNTLRNLESSEDALDLNIKYWLKKGKLIGLKKGVYILRDKWEKERNKNDYLEYLANQLLLPSYVSLEYVLSKYQIMTEAVNAITSVTPKSGRSFNNELASFDYYSISEKIFTGYETKTFKNASVNIASKEKALFDFLYFQFRKKEPNEQNIDNLRLNWENITKKELQKSKKYSELTDNKNIKKVFDIIL